MKHTMRLNPQPFARIKSGQKTIEMRLYDEKRRLIRIGDEIEFVHSSNDAQRLRCIVVDLHKFSSFHQLYDHLNLLQCGYTDGEIATASPADMEKYYSVKEQERYGVVGIEIKVL